MIKKNNKRTLPNLEKMSDIYPCIFSAPLIITQSVTDIQGINLLRPATIFSREIVKSAVHELISLDDTVGLFKVLEQKEPKFANLFCNSDPLPIFSSLSQSYFLTEGYKKRLTHQDEKIKEAIYSPYLRRGEIGLIHINSICRVDNGLLYIDPNAFVYLRTHKNKIEWINEKLLQTLHIVDDLQLVDQVHTMNYFNIPFIDLLVLVKRTENGQYLLIDSAKKLPIDLLENKKLNKSKLLNVELEYFDIQEIDEYRDIIKHKRIAIEENAYNTASDFHKLEKNRFQNMQMSKNHKLRDFYNVVTKIGNTRFSDS